MTHISKEARVGRIVAAAALLAAAAYTVILPTCELLLEGATRSSTDVPAARLPLRDEIEIRFAKLIVFVVFAYLGASVGSFLNVVAASAPRGNSIATRFSACPQCGKPIRLCDNLPILSYILLRGQCRDCATAIPLRYFAVELLGFAIFGLLFLYELVMGAANIPGMQTYYSPGILSIIVYTKWSVLGIYLFHCALFSCLLMLTLIEQDRLHAPRWMQLTLPTFFFGLVLVVPALQPVSFGDQTAWQLPAACPAWLDRAANSLAGGLLGLTVAYLAKRRRNKGRQPARTHALAWGVLGIALGWQALLTIAVLWLAARLCVSWVEGQWERPRWLTATALLWVIAMLHHPAWKFLAERFAL